MNNKLILININDLWRYWYIKKGKIFDNTFLNIQNNIQDNIPNNILNKKYIFEDTIDKCNITSDTYNMVDFLKKYSTIPTQFIDDFYGIVKDYEELNYSFYISLDIVSRWMNQTKGNVKRTLIKKFVKMMIIL